MSQGSVAQRTLYASAARTATPTQVTQYSSRGERGGHFIINVSAASGTPSVVPTIEGYDALSATWYTILAGPAITATGTTILKVYPGFNVSPSASASDLLPQTWRVTMTHGEGSSITYSVSATLIP